MDKFQKKKNVYYLRFAFLIQFLYKKKWHFLNILRHSYTLVAAARVVEIIITLNKKSFRSNSQKPKSTFENDGFRFRFKNQSFIVTLIVFSRFNRRNSCSQIVRQQNSKMITSKINRVKTRRGDIARKTQKVRTGIFF